MGVIPFIKHKQHLIKAAHEHLFDGMDNCSLCPRNCGVNRLSGDVGYCRAPAALRIASVCIHHGEEPPISGTGGSGTVFFSHCNLGCVFCQNYQISHHGQGKSYSAEDLAQCMVNLQKRGSHNINLVSPTPYLPWILESLYLAYEQGLSLPIVYNTHGYESVEVLECLKGIIDIYLPDFKYAVAKTGALFSGAADYPHIGRQAITLMFDQTGLLVTNPHDIAEKGVIVRHLVLPGYLENTRLALDFLAGLHPDITISLMSQYFPSHHARSHPPIDRRLSEVEYDSIVEYAVELGLENTFIQELSSAENYAPDFSREHPFHECGS